MEIPGNGNNFKQAVINTYLSECNEYKTKYYKLEQKLLDMGLKCKSCNRVLSHMEIKYVGYGECFSCNIKWILPLLKRVLTWLCSD